MNFGEKLKNLRKKHGLSQDQLGKLLNLGASTIGQYETNSREPNFERLKKIKDFFNIDYNFLLEDSKKDREKLKKIELDVVDLVSVLRKNYVTINGKKLNQEAVDGLIQFLENY